MSELRDQQNYFDEVSREYDEYYEHPQTIMDYEKRRRLETALSLATPSAEDDVLVIGVGAGELTRAIGDRAGRTVGIDFSRAMLDLARDRAGGEYVQGVVQNLPIRDGGLDTVFCLGVIGYLEDGEAMRSIGELGRVLAPNGNLVLSFANARSPFRRFRRFYYRTVLETGKRLTGLGDSTEHRYTAYPPKTVESRLKTAGLSVLDRRYLTYATGIVNRSPNVRLYRALDERFADVDAARPLAMTWIIHATNAPRQ